MAGRLFLVATPLGDPDDITVRALRVLAAVGTIAAEDTRVTGALLAHHGISARLLSYHDHNEDRRVAGLIQQLLTGGDVALVSDAGTPLINDPGYRLVDAAVRQGIEVIVVPGACAVIAALVGSGLPVDRFVFGGFVPRENGERNATLDALGHLGGTMIFYESPVRLPSTLDALAERWPARRVVVARNLTKAWEQWIRGTATEVRAILGDESRGEVVLLIGPGDKDADWNAADALINRLLAKGERAKDVRDAVSDATGLPKREIYQRILSRPRES